MDIIGVISINAILLCASIFDIRSKTIPAWFIVLSTIISLVFSLFINHKEPKEIVFGIISGFIVWMIAKISSVIGEGDGLILVVTGCQLGYMGNIRLLLVSVFFAAIISILLIVFLRKDIKTALPFMPFLFIGYIAVNIGQWCVEKEIL